MELSGIVVPVVTPFDDSGRLDLMALDAVVESLLRAGVHGLVAAGTTGEGYALSLEERRTVVARVAKIASGSVPVLAGVGGQSTDQAIDHALLAKTLKVSGLMVSAPSYCLPNARELTAHVQAVVAAAGLPTVLYDYPARTGVSFSIDSLDELAVDPLIVGIKEASGDLTRIPLLQDRYGASLDVVCGSDAAAVAFIDSGVRCWIGGAANVLPRAHVAMLDVQLRYEVAEATRPILSFIEDGGYIAKVKAGMGLLGIAVGNPRAPLAPLDESGTEQLNALLGQAGSWSSPLS